MDCKNDTHYLSVPPGMAKRKERSKLLEDAGNFYNKLFVIYAKHVKTDDQTYDNIEHLQQKASEFLKLVKRASFHDKTGIFSKPIISITSDTTDVIDTVIPVDKPTNTIDEFSPVNEQHDDNKVSDSEDILSPGVKEALVSEISKTIESNITISSRDTIDYYVNSPRHIQDSKSELSNGGLSPSAGYNPEGYALDHIDHESVKSPKSIIENDTNEVATCEILQSENKITNEITVVRNMSPRVETTSIHSSNSFQPERREHVDKFSQTDTMTISNNNINKLTSINCNIYWESIEMFDKELNLIPYSIILLLFLASMLSISSSIGLIIAFNNQLTTIIPLISICVYGIIFTIITKFNHGNLTRAAIEWKRQLKLSDLISIQLPNGDWIGNYVKDIMKLNYHVTLKWMGGLLIGVSILGFFNMNFLFWPWGIKEWIYSSSQIVILLLFTIALMTCTPILPNAAKYFSIKIIFSLFQMQSNGLCSLSIFGENSPFLIRRSDFIPSHEISQSNANKIIPTLVFVLDNGKICLFEQDKYIVISPPITADRHGHSSLYITSKHVIINDPDFYVFNGGLFYRFLYCLKLIRLLPNKLTTALEFDTKFALDTFLSKLNVSNTDALNNNDGSDHV